MKIKQVMLEFDTSAKLLSAMGKLDDAYDTTPTTYTRMGLNLIIAPMYPIDDLSPLLPLVTAS